MSKESLNAVDRLERQVRDAVVDFKLEHSVEPTALGLGEYGVEVARRSKLVAFDVDLQQATFMGYPVIILNRPKAVEMILIRRGALAKEDPQTGMSVPRHGGEG